MCATAGMLMLSAVPARSQTGTVLVQEGFNDTSFAARGWYDGFPAITNSEKYSGAAAMECQFAVGGTKCAAGLQTRHQFVASDSVYISFYIKHSQSGCAA